MKSALNCLLAASQTVRPRVRRPSVHLAGNLGSLARAAAAAAAFPFQLHSASLSGDLLIPIDHFLHFSVGSEHSRGGGGQKSASLAPMKTCTGMQRRRPCGRDLDTSQGFALLGNNSLFTFSLHFFRSSDREHETADTDFINGGGREPLSRRRPTRD